MPLGPRPRGFTAAGEDADILTGQHGRLGVNVNSSGDFAVDIETRRNARTPSESDYGGEHPC